MIDVFYVKTKNLTKKKKRDGIMFKKCINELNKYNSSCLKFCCFFNKKLKKEYKKKFSQRTKVEKIMTS